MCYILITGCNISFCGFIFRIERMRTMREKDNKNRGITLIALVVTIVVLLILAGISISMLTGQNGILNRAAEAKEKTEVAQKECKKNKQSNKRKQKIQSKKRYNI